MHWSSASAQDINKSVRRGPHMHSSKSTIIISYRSYSTGPVVCIFQVLYLTDTLNQSNRP
jgi:hypothetical protein